MKSEIRSILEETPVIASAPCRIDLGGTIDIAVFYYPLSYLAPSTFNIAVNLRTFVRLFPYTPGFVSVSSTGFSPAAFPIDEIPFDHPLGLVFIIAAYFRIDGIHIEIESTSPPKSALGGSSAAAVAVIAAFDCLLKKTGKSGVDIEKIPFLAHAMEESTSNIPCGCQDQMAATYGGVHAWQWKGHGKNPWFDKKRLVGVKDYPWVNGRIIVAYCGKQHESRDINGKWIRHFIGGKNRRKWIEIIECTKGFINAFEEKNVESAVAYMNRESAIRSEITPGVFDSAGEKLVAAALKNDCGARFTGAGGGGCIWAFGEPERISALQSTWTGILNTRKEACLLDTSVDMKGVEAK